MAKKKTITIKTVRSGPETESEKLLRQLAFLLFTAAGRTGGAFKIEKAAQDRYEAGTGDLHIVLAEEDTRNNGDVFVTIIRDRG